MRNKKDRKRKTDRPSLRILRRVILMIFLCFLIFVCSEKTLSLLKSSPYFVVKKITYSKSLDFLNKRTLKQLEGKSLFDVDARVIQEKLQANHPYIAQLRVLKKFPDEIVILARRRRPFFQAKVRGANVTLDREGVILAVSQDIDPKLPFVVGLDVKRADLSLGVRMESEKLKVAKEMIEQFRGNRRLGAYEIAEIDVGNLSAINFMISNNLKIIINRDEIYHKINKLDIVL